MTESRSDLSAAEIVEGLRALLGSDAVLTDEHLLREASIDRF